MDSFGVFFFVATFAVLGFLFLVPPGHSAPRCFLNDRVEQVLPPGLPSYPEEFRGVLWMDQGGYYAHSDVPFSAPDLALSFGDQEFSRWDPVSRTLSVDITGPAWTWMNRPDGHMFYWFMQKLGYFYLFKPNDDFSVIQVLPSVNWGPLGKLSLPKQILSFTMEKIQQTPGSCPPKPGASKKDIAKCATWDRVSSGLLSPLFGPFGVIHYYVFQIIDGKGKRIQPYYDVYQAYANHSYGHQFFTANIIGMSRESNGKDSPCHIPSTAFVGERVAGAGKAADGGHAGGPGKVADGGRAGEL